MRIVDGVNKTDSLGKNDRSLNLKYGAQQGYMPALGSKLADGVIYEEWLNNAAHLPENMIPFVVSVPKGFEFFDDPQGMADVFISIMESHPESIEGPDATVTIERDSHPIGIGGQVQHEIKKVSRSEATSKYTIREKQGKPINKFLNIMQKYLMGDVDTQKPLVTLFQKFKDKDVFYTPEYWTWATIFVEPDITQTRVVEAYLLINQSLNTTGQRSSKRNHDGKEMLVYEIDTGGILIMNDEVNRYAQVLLDNLTVAGINPDSVVPPIDIDNLTSAVKDSKFGYDGYSNRDA